MLVYQAIEIVITSQDRDISDGQFVYSRTSKYLHRRVLCLINNIKPVLTLQFTVLMNANTAPMNVWVLYKNAPAFAAIALRYVGRSQVI